MKPRQIIAIVVGAALATGGIVAYAGSSHGDDARSLPAAQSALSQWDRPQVSRDGLDFNALHGRLALECVKASGGQVPDSVRLASTRSATVPGTVTGWQRWTLTDSPGFAAALAKPGVIEIVVQARSRATAQSEGLNQAARELYFGVPRQYTTVEKPGGGKAAVLTSGCLGKATQALYGAPADVVERVMWQAGQLTSIVDDASTQSAVLRANETYVQCMKTEQFVVDNPQSLPRVVTDQVEAVLQRPDTLDQLRDLEAKYTAADTKCKESSGVMYVFADAVAPLARDRATQFNDALAQQAKFFEHAEQVAASAPVDR